MLDPDLVLTAVVETFQSIPEVVEQLGGLLDEDGDPTIVGHFYSYGAEDTLARHIYSMRSPSILVAYLDLLGGNFDGATIWKHRLEVYIRPKNAASGTVGNPSLSFFGCTAPHLWWLMMNKSITGTSQNIRQISLMSGSLIPMDTPTLKHAVDETQADLWIGSLVLPEWGDE